MHIFGARGRFFRAISFTSKCDKTFFGAGDPLITSIKVGSHFRCARPVFSCHFVYAQNRTKSHKITQTRTNSHKIAKKRNAQKIAQKQNAQTNRTNTSHVADFPLELSSNGAGVFEACTPSGCVTLRSGRAYRSLWRAKSMAALVACSDHHARSRKNYEPNVAGAQRMATNGGSLSYDWTLYASDNITS